MASTRRMDAGAGRPVWRQQLVTDGVGNTGGARLTVEPASAQLDEPVAVRLSDLPPGQRVTLRAATTDPFDQTWRSAAVFRADASGAVDAAAQAPESGSYAGVEPMGLFWSMAPTSPDGPPLPVERTEPLRVVVAA